MCTLPLGINQDLEAFLLPASPTPSPRDPTLGPPPWSWSVADPATMPPRAHTTTSLLVTMDGQSRLRYLINTLILDKDKLTPQSLMATGAKHSGPVSVTLHPFPPFL